MIKIAIEIGIEIVSATEASPLSACLETSSLLIDFNPNFDLHTVTARKCSFPTLNNIKLVGYDPTPRGEFSLIRANHKDTAMPIESIYPEELSAFSAKLREAEYTLVDVRQPGEYQGGHIPGSRLLPLPEIESHLDELATTPNLVFYCRSGARSQAAANLAQATLPAGTRILNMIGGFMAWDGQVLTDMPRLKVFAPDRESIDTTSQALLRAMELEKAAQRFYQVAESKAISLKMVETLATLGKVERTHARVIFHRLQRADADYAQRDFETCFDELTGDILEGGESLEVAVARLDSPGPDGRDSGFCLSVTELALMIEIAAYDLYKNLAGVHAGTELEPVFQELAEDELKHQRLLARLLPECAA
jgi:sulfur-carrier protein adenylyltransferase/sulfurtransferase